MTNWFVRRSGLFKTIEDGPWTFPQMLALYARGKLPGQSLVRKSDETEWAPLWDTPLWKQLREEASSFKQMLPDRARRAQAAEPQAHEPQVTESPEKPPLPATIERTASNTGIVKHPVLLAVIVAVAGWWAWVGFPSPDTLMHRTTASQECVDFAEKHRAELFFNTRGEVRATRSWLKNGHVVVELGAFESGATSYLPRICIIGGGRIEIVSILEMGAWR